jgi:hypothetical protein
LHCMPTSRLQSIVERNGWQPQAVSVVAARRMAWALYGCFASLVTASNQLSTTRLTVPCPPTSPQLRDITDIHVMGTARAYEVGGCAPQQGQGKDPSQGCLVPEPPQPGCMQHVKSSSRLRAACERAVITTRILGFHRIWQGSNKVGRAATGLVPPRLLESLQWSSRGLGAKRGCVGEVLLAPCLFYLSSPSLLMCI